MNKILHWLKHPVIWTTVIAAIFGGSTTAIIGSITAIYWGFVGTFAAIMVTYALVAIASFCVASYIIKRRESQIAERVRLDLENGIIAKIRADVDLCIHEVRTCRSVFEANHDTFLELQSRIKEEKTDPQANLR